MRRPSGENATSEDRSGHPPIFSPRSTSQIASSRSCPVASFVPCGENARASISALVPCNYPSIAPLATRQSRIPPLPSPLAIRSPPASKARALTALSWPLRVRNSLLLRRSQSRTCRSSEPVARIASSGAKATERTRSACPLCTTSRGSRDAGSSAVALRACRVRLCRGGCTKPHGEFLCRSLGTADPGEQRERLRDHSRAGGLPMPKTSAMASSGEPASVTGVPVTAPL